MSYQLVLTDEDWKTIRFVGGRYEWADALLAKLPCGDVEADGTQTYRIRESTAWELCEAFAADMDGGHEAFPMLDPRSELWEKLQGFWDSIV